MPISLDQPYSLKVTSEQGEVINITVRTGDSQTKLVTLSDKAKNNITLSNALGFVSISLDEINDVDTTGIENGQTIVYQDGTFVAGDSGSGSQTLSGLTDTNIINVQGGDVIAWNVGASKWMVSDGLQTLLSLLKSQSGTQLYSTSLDTDKGYIDLQATTAKMGLGQSFLKVTQTSPGVLTFSIACGAEGAETEFEAFKLQGTTTAGVADLLIQSGCRFKMYDANGYEVWIRPSGGMTGNVTLVTPATGGTLALQSEIPTSVTDLSDVTSAGSGAIITTAERDAIGGMPAGGTTGQALVKVDGTDYNTQWADIAIDVQYHNRYATTAETLRSGATETVELYFLAQADGNGLAESAQSDTATTGYDIQRKLYYSEAAQADPDTGTWVQFATIPDNTTFASAKATLLAYLKERTGGTVPISLKMTWEEVSQAVTPLLDTYTGAAGAYSLRKLRTAYTGSAIEVYNGTSYQDIGFNASNELDTVGLASFCGGNDGFVSKWYDQSGNANHAAQTSTGSMPKIYDSVTGVIPENSKPCMDFASSKFMALSSAAISDLSSTAVSIFMVCTPPDTTTDGVAYTLTDTAATSNVLSLSFNRTTGVYVVTRYTPTATRSGDTHGVNQSIFSFVSTGASNATGYEDGTQATTTPTQARGAFQNAIGSNNATVAGFTFEGTIQEMVIYASNPSRTGVESDLATFYGITL